MSDMRNVAQPDLGTGDCPETENRMLALSEFLRETDQDYGQMLRRLSDGNSASGVDQ